MAEVAEKFASFRTHRHCILQKNKKSQYLRYKRRNRAHVMSTLHMKNKLSINIYLYITIVLLTQKYSKVLKALTQFLVP